MTGRREILLGVWVVTLTLTVNAQVKDRAEVLLQAAIKQELVEGDLKGAIDQFKKIAENSSPDVAAEALMHMAACYDKLGHAEARTIYERVLREYPNQKKAVAEARAWLEEHGSPASSQAGMRLEQVWAAEGASSAGRPSADGRYLPFTDWATGNGNLALRDLKTGENRLLTHDAASNAWAGVNSLVSPDGKQVAYVWEGGKDDSIRLIGVDGTGMRVLARRAYGDYLEAWSPDGRHLGVHNQSGADGTNQIILVSTADGSITQLKSTGWRWPLIGGFSPDGRFLVYSLPRDPNGVVGGEDVFALAINGTREIPLVQDSANNTSPVWSPDGRRVVFVSDRSGAASLWAIQVVDGRPEGSPALLRANVGTVTPKGFTRDGSYYYGTETLSTEAYIAEFDPETLTVTKPALVTDRFVGSNFKPEISPDGKYVAFLRRAGEAIVSRTPTLMVRSLATGEERALDPKGGYGRLLWFPDSRSLLVQGGEGGRSTFRKIGLEPSDTRPLFETAQLIWNTAALSPDGKAVFYTVAEIIGDRSGPGDLKVLRLVKRRLDTGEETELHRTESVGFGFFGLTVSSDGSRLAFQLNVAGRKRALMIMPADGGTPREIHLDGLSHNGAMSWTPDGRHLIVTGKCGPGGSEQLCAIATDGGDLTPLGLGMQGISSRMISADGRRIAFTGATRKGELWVIRNLLPAPARTQ